MDKLHFTTAGMPTITGKGGYNEAFDILKSKNLDGMELEFVHGVRISEPSQKSVMEHNKNFVLTAHAPYYINMNSKEEKKVEASITRILDTAKMGEKLGAYSITYHAGFYMGDDKENTFKKILEVSKRLFKQLKKENLKIWVRPETTGKGTQWGDLDEIIRLSKEFDTMLPCVDFAHLHARFNGVSNTYDEFCKIFEKLGNELGQKALENLHAHVAGIAYSVKGEKHHLMLDESDMNYKDLLKALKHFDVKGVLVCESPIMEDDAVLLKTFYESL